MLPSGHNFIKEIFVNDRHLLKPDAVLNEGPPKPPEPRQKFQRFRQKKFVCDECDRWFTMKQNVQQHFFQYHNPNGAKKKAVRIISKRFQCTKCNKIFKTLEKAQRHEARLHGENVSPNVFVCQLCNKVYNAHSQLKEHVDVVHENLRPYKCEHCGMDFGRAGGLRRHDMMVHQQKLHACPYEGCEHPGYKCTKALAAHIRSVHTMDRPFKCLFCDRSFVRKNDLKVHENTHSSQSEFVCKKCKCPFRRLIYLQKHEKRCNGKERRRKFSRRRSWNDSALVSVEPEKVVPFDGTISPASQSLEECEYIVEEKSVDVEEAIEEALELDDEGDLSLEVTQENLLIDEENADATEEPKDVEGDDLEDGELSGSSSLEYRRSRTHKKSHRSKKHHSHHSHHSRKKHRKTLLKLPRKSIRRGDKEKTVRVVEVESENRDKRETTIKRRIKEMGTDIYPSRLIRFEEEVKKEECINRRVRFEPREEAFNPKKCSLPVNSFLLCKQRKLDPRKNCIEADNKRSS